MECTVRRGRTEDSGAVQRLVREVLAEYGIGGDHSAGDADLIDLEASYAGAGGVFYVLVDGAGEIVGSAGLMPVREGVAELRKMYLRPRVRGKGYGKLLLRMLLDEARALGFARVELETADVLKEAIALYEAHGFRRSAPAHPSWRCDRVCALDFALDL